MPLACLPGNGFWRWNLRGQDLISKGKGLRVHCCTLSHNLKIPKFNKQSDQATHHIFIHARTMALYYDDKNVQHMHSYNSQEHHVVPLRTQNQNYPFSRHDYHEDGRNVYRLTGGYHLPCPFEQYPTPHSSSCWNPPHYMSESWGKDHWGRPSTWLDQDYHGSLPPRTMFEPPSYPSDNSYFPLSEELENCRPPSAPLVAVKKPQGQSSLHEHKSEGGLKSLDIVVGRGAPKNFHYGNQVFRDLVKDYQTKYLCAKRSDKPQIALKLLDAIKATGARFVKRQKTSGSICTWVQIDDKGAYEKVCQALRDGAPDLQRKMLSSLAKKGKN